jgi:hypothetical protein
VYKVSEQKHSVTNYYLISVFAREGVSQTTEGDVHKCESFIFSMVIDRLKGKQKKCVARKQDAYFTRKDAQQCVTSCEGYHAFVTPTMWSMRAFPSTWKDGLESLHPMYGQGNIYLSATVALACVWRIVACDMSRSLDAISWNSSTTWLVSQCSAASHLSILLRLSGHCLPSGDTYLQLHSSFII